LTFLKKIGIDSASSHPFMEEDYDGHFTLARRKCFEEHIDVFPE
jgi:hypothetical protein